MSFIDEHCSGNSAIKGVKLFDDLEAVLALFSRSRYWRVRIGVEGFDTSLPEEDIKKALTEIFSSCGEIQEIVIPRHPDRRASVYLLGEGAQEKALALDGTDAKGWKVVAKPLPLPVPKYPAFGVPFGSSLNTQE